MPNFRPASDIAAEINQRLSTFSWNHPSLVKLNALFKFNEKKKGGDQIRVLALIGSQLRTAIRIMPILLKKYALVILVMESDNSTLSDLWVPKIFYRLSEIFVTTYSGEK